MVSRTSSALFTTGGRTRVRRLLAAATLFISLSASTAGATSGGRPRVTVDTDGGIYRVTATFNVPQPASVVMAVLTDYERIPRFMPDVRTSQLLDRRDDQAIVEQEAVANFMIFSKRIHLVLEVQETPGSLRFRDRCGASFTRYEGAWSASRNRVV